MIEGFEIMNAGIYIIIDSKQEFQGKIGGK